MSVEVALAVTPPQVVGVQENVPEFWSVPQIMLPDASVSRSPVQLRTLKSLRLPSVMVTPASVEVADVERRVVERPPAKVEVALEVEMILPNCPTPPSTNEPWSPVAEERPPANVEVAVEVEVRVPKVAEPEVSEEKIPEGERKILAKREVVVALVVVALVVMRFEKVLMPVKMFESESKVDEAKVQVDVEKV